MTLKLYEIFEEDEIKDLIGMTVTDVKIVEGNSKEPDLLAIDFKNADGDIASIHTNSDGSWFCGKRKTFITENMLNGILGEFNKSIDDTDYYYTKDAKLMFGNEDDECFICGVGDIEQISIIDDRIILTGEKLGTKFYLTKFGLEM